MLGFLFEVCETTFARALAARRVAGTMSSGLGKGIGIPIKLLHESEGHTVTVRLRQYRRRCHPMRSVAAAAPLRARQGGAFSDPPGSRPVSLCVR